MIEGICQGSCNSGIIELVEVRHDWQRGVTIVYLCNKCKKEPLCYGNSTGIHSEIYDGHEDPTQIPPCTDGLEPGQYGWCSLCGMFFFWSPDRHRWVPMEKSKV